MSTVPPDAAPIRFLESARLYLRPLVPADAEGRYPGWLNNPEACAGNGHHVYPYTAEQARSYIEQVRGSTDLVLAVVVKEGDLHIGNIALTNIHPLYRKAEFGILLGERASWGQGYGLEAGRLLIRHGFRSMNLERIECGTLAGNVGMQRLAIALGMTQEGIRRRAAYKDGGFIDIVEFGILRDDHEGGVRP